MQSLRKLTVSATLAILFGLQFSPTALAEPYSTEQQQNTDQPYDHEEGHSTAELRDGNDKHNQNAKPDMKQVEFRVASIQTKAIPGARIIVIGDKGKILATGLTDSSGVWKVSLPLQPDPRFPEARLVDTVTAIAIATGYNEQAVFEVPVATYAVQPIIMNPVEDRQRNEPTVSLGNLHRHDVIGLINHYANKLNLKKQRETEGEFDYAPWSPHKN